MAIGELAPLLAAVVVMPALVRGLGTDRLGLLQIAWVVIGYFSVLDLGLGRATTRIVALRESEGRHDEVGELLLTATCALFVLGAASGAILAAVTPWLASDVLRLPGELHGEARGALYVLAVTLPIVVGSAGLRGLLEARSRFGSLALVRTALGVASFVGPLAVLPLSSSVVPVVVALALARVVAFLAQLFLCRDVVLGSPESTVLRWSVLPELLRYGGWLTVSNVTSPLLVLLDRFAIASLVSVDALAFYATPLDVVQRVGVMPAAIGMVLFPAVAGSNEPGRRTDLVSSGLRLSVAVVFPMLFVLSTWAPELLRIWLGPTFAIEGAPVVRCVAVGLLVNAVGVACSFYLQAIGRPDLPAKLHVGELVLYVPLLFWLASSYGVVGAALAWTLRVVIDSIALFIATDAVAEIPRRIALRVAAATTMGATTLIVAHVGRNTSRGLVMWSTVAMAIVLLAYLLLAEELRRLAGKRVTR